MRSKSMLLIAASLLFFLPAATYAWNKAGHLVTAAIAYHELKAIDPQALARVIALLKKHPHFSTTWRPQIEQVQPDDPDLLLFILAARWPDDIRNTNLHCEKCLSFAKTSSRHQMPHIGLIKLQLTCYIRFFQVIETKGG